MDLGIGSRFWLTVPLAPVYHQFEELLTPDSWRDGDRAGDGAVGFGAASGGGNCPIGTVTRGYATQYVGVSGYQKRDGWEPGGGPATGFHNGVRTLNGAPAGTS